MDLLFAFGLGLLGLLVGSFIGALSFRLPLGRPISKGRSVCDFCGKKISWFDNVPIVSYFLLRGTCRKCGKKISPRYPLIEAVTAVGFMAIGILLKGYPVGSLGFYLVVFSGTLVVFITDLEHHFIADSVSFFLWIFVIFYLLFTGNPNFFVNLEAGFLAALFLLFINLVTRGRGMGLGDVKFALFAGTLLGFPQSLIWLFVSFLTGAAVGIILILVRRAKFGKPIAFGPFLAVSLVITILFGGRILGWLF